MKKFFAILIATMLCMSMSFAAFAAEATEVPVGSEVVAEEVSSDDGIMPLLETKGFWIGENNQFVTVYTRPSSIDRLVKIEVSNFQPNDYQMDIIMWGKDGILWSEDDCLHSSNTRTFEVSKNCTSISVRIIPRSRLFPAKAKNFYVTSTY